MLPTWSRLKGAISAYRDAVGTTVLCLNYDICLTIEMAPVSVFRREIYCARNVHGEVLSFSASLSCVDRNSNGAERQGHTMASDTSEAERS